MLRKIDWGTQIGRRLKLRDLHAFTTVVQCGSMAKAAQKLGVSQPAVSEIIADLEHALGVRLVDRGSRGVEATVYGHALLKRSIAAFDELKQSLRDIEFLSDPTVGEVRVACTEALSVTLLPEVILRFSEQYPKVKVEIELTGYSKEFSGLRERKYDCMLQTASVDPEEHAIDDLNVEVLFDDTMVVAAGVNSRWGRRRKIDLIELIHEPWILSAVDTWHHARVKEIFGARGISLPNSNVTAMSIFLRARLLAGGPCLSMFMSSVVKRLIKDRYAIAALPVDLPAKQFSSRIVTLTKRTLSPVVERFLACLREVAKSAASSPASRVPARRGPISLEGQTRQNSKRAQRVRLSTQ